MADWLQPALADSHIDYRDKLTARDVDAFTLGLDTITNPPMGAIRFNRSDDLFEEWDGSAWVVLLLSLEGGGTGAANAPDVRTNLGIGSIATQNANSVSITGGTVSGLGSLGVNGNTTIGGTLGVTGIITGPGSGLTALNGSNISSGTVAAARLGSGTANVDKVLRGDNTWGDFAVLLSLQLLHIAGALVSGGATFLDFALGTTVTDPAKCVINTIWFSASAGSNTVQSIRLISGSTLRVQMNNNNAIQVAGSFQILEHKAIG